VAMAIQIKIKAVIARIVITKNAKKSQRNKERRRYLFTTEMKKDGQILQESAS
jgi:hypothetical protein